MAGESGMLPDVGAARAEKRDSSLFPVTFRGLCIPGDFPVGDFLGNFPGDFPGDFPVQYMKSNWPDIHATVVVYLKVMASHIAFI